MPPITDPSIYANMSSLRVEPEKLRIGGLPNDVGQTALNVLSGTLVDTRDPNNLTKTLTGKINTYRKMQADPTIGGALQGYENILSLVQWNVAPADRERIGLSEDDFDEELAEEYREFISSCFNDMGSSSIGDIISAALDMLAIGFQVTVPQFKVRSGYSDDSRLNSRFDDGKIGWKNFKPIRQESIDRWLVRDGEGYEDLKGLIQFKVSGGRNTILRNRMLLFRTTNKGGNMEGESIIYSAVSTWATLQKVLDIEVVSLSRNLEGIPKLSLASRYLSDNATEEEKTLTNFLIRQVKSIKFNEQTAVVVPSDVDPETGVPYIDITLMTAGNNVRVDQCRKAANAKEQLIAESILASFLKLSSGGGSYALGSSLQDMFILAMKKYLDNISSVINNEAIPTLMRLNGMDARYAPTLEHEGLDTDSLGVFIDALVKTVQSGVVVPTIEMNRAVLKKLGLPTAGSDKAWDDVEELQNTLNELSQQALEADAQTQTQSGTNQQQGTETNPEALQKNLDRTEIFEIEGKLYRIEDDELIEVPFK